jgi:hypothetical protein
MRSVADQLREESRWETRCLSAAERIERAFQLGEEGLATFMKATGLDRRTAVRELERRRQRGRRPSRSMSEIIES